MRLFDKLFRYEAIDRIFSDREYLQSLLDFEAGSLALKLRLVCFPSRTRRSSPPPAAPTSSTSRN